MPMEEPFTHTYEYDSWNRMLSLAYPDGERVHYTYNRAGDLQKMTGDKNGNDRFFHSSEKMKVVASPFISFSASTFTGKETDCETGFSYFGARYYDPTLLTSWTAIDPMSDKYPNLSPYNYCAWNPMKLVDPDGNDWYIPEGQNTPVYDKNVTANKYPEGATYVGETAHWFGQVESDMNLYYQGDNEGNVTATDMTVNIDAKRMVVNIPTERSWVGNLEYNIDEFFHKDFWTNDVATFEDKFEEKAQAVMTSLASAMPIVSQANSIHTLSKGEDMFGNKVETIDFVLSATGFIGSGLKFFKSKTLKKASQIVETGSTGLSSIRSGRGIQKKRQDSRGGGK